MEKMRLPGVEPGSIAWKAIILTVGLQTLVVYGGKI
ncbi:transcription factor bHLH30-like protein [Corchorus olitorius]|uniref:Transcription factor bHLH30-like protein n=1 Tax=Corchorus olitorius TaxID=93759 RepID=A0A1R3KG91_9ROSI|nr:transcription factor bHLH30-like protein [Corchorus olitorius]